MSMWEEAQRQEMIFWQLQKYDIHAGYRKKDSIILGDFKFPGKSILEVGCGAIPVLSIVECGEKCVIDPLMDEYKKIKNNDLAGMRCAKGIAEELPYPSKCFDIVFCLNMLDHTEHPFKILDECCRVLKVGGSLYIGTDLRTDKTINGCHPTAITKDEIVKCLTATGMSFVSGGVGTGYDIDTAYKARWDKHAET